MIPCGILRVVYRSWAQQLLFCLRMKLEIVVSNRVPFHRLLNKLTTHISAAPNTQQRITKSPHMRCFNFPGQRRGEGWRKIQGIHVAMWNCTRFAPTFDADRKGQQKTVRRQVVFNGAIVFKGLHFGPIPTRLLGLGLCFFLGARYCNPRLVEIGKIKNFGQEGQHCYCNRWQYHCCYAL